MVAGRGRVRAGARAAARQGQALRSLRVARKAERDLDSISDYVAEHWGAMVAETILGDLCEAFELIAATPGEIGTARPEIQRGVRSFPVGHHVVYFRYGRTWVEIARVLHERRDVARAFGSPRKRWGR